jgi:hypothetical protein
MSKDKVKLYRNPDRNKVETRTTYTPQYQVMGIEPEEFKSAIAPTVHPAHVVAKSPTTADNPRVRQPSIRQAYAETVPSPVGRGKGPVPNVGNNMEHTWSTVDGEIVDDISSEIPDDQPMIDNNDYVSDAALGLSGQDHVEFHEDLPTLDEVANPSKKKFVVQAEVATDLDDVMPALHNLDEGEYLLIVNGVAVCSGPADEIQEQARLLVFGEHEMCDGNPIPIDDILIIKRVSIKVGLFLE